MNKASRSFSVNGKINKLIFVILFFFITSCAERKFTIQTKPENVLCEINGRQIGTTPIVVKYVENGFFKIHLSKEGFENYDGKFKLKKKWFSMFVLDFVGEVLPHHWVDEQHIEFSLKPIQNISHEMFKKQMDEQRQKKSE